jgi:Lrp/AsnC family transcriptional regulator for asnA, asnC and gidA
MARVEHAAEAVRGGVRHDPAIRRRARDYDGPRVTENRSELQRAVGLSDVDRELIRLLQLDGRRSYAELARALGVAEKKVRRRLTELRDSGIIYITAVADPSVLGYRTVAMLGIRAGRRAPSDVARDLTTIDAVDYVILSTGRYDVFAEVFCRNLNELRDIVEGTVRVVDGVDDVEIFPYLRLHYQEGAFGAPDAEATLTHVPSDISVDQVDRAIVAHLSEDGRVPLQRVAERLETSEAQVRRRLKRLQDWGALRVMAITNPMSLGFEAIAKLGITVAPGYSVAEFADTLADVESTSYVALCAGRFDILSEAVCVTTEELASVIDDEIRTIPGIARCEVFIYLGLHYKPLRPATLLEGAQADGAGGDAGGAPPSEAWVSLG